MAQNFKIHSHREKNSIHLNLAGDFDGNSACELLHVIKQLNGKKIPIYINTDGLHKIYDFGCDVFRKKLALVNDRPDLPVFIGRYQARMAFQN